MINQVSSRLYHAPPPYEGQNPRRLQEKATVGVGIGAHATLPLPREIGELGAQFAGVVKQLLWTVALRPFLQDFDMARMTHIAHRHLIRAPRAFGFLAVHRLRDGPAFR